jgi:hypothetical protein
MYDKGKIITGIIIFLIVATFPFWYNLGKAAPQPDPKTDTPAIKNLIKKECVEPKAFMKTYHMQLLDKWRDTVVRDGDRVYMNTNGIRYEMSLQNTCMKCHSNKAKFCDQCHNYLRVIPYCWTCHIEPKEKT